LIILEEGVRSHRVRSQESGGRKNKEERKKKEEKSPMIVQILFILNPYMRNYLILNSGLLILKLSKNYHFPRFFLLTPDS
jgi:hypothetical protein